MIVMHLLSSNKYSGAENVVCQIIQLYKLDPDFEMVYCSPYGSIGKELSEKDIEYFPIKKLSIKQVWLAIRKIKPDIIHAHDVRASIVAGVFKSYARIISHMHINHMNMRHISLKSLLYLISSPMYEKIVWVSNSAIANYRFGNYVSKKSVVLYNVIESSEVQKKAEMSNQEKEYDICFVGRLTMQKDPLRMLNIITEIYSDMPELKVALIGDGELYSEVIDQIRRDKLELVVDVFGFISNPYPIIKKSKIMLMTSKFEGTPMCALEAMILGLPIVSTPTDGMINIVQDDLTGYLVGENCLIVEKIKAILGSPKLRERMSSNAKLKSVNLNDTLSYKSKIDVLYSGGSKS